MKLGETVFVVKFRKKNEDTWSYYTPEYGSAYKPHGWGSVDFEDAKKFSCRLSVDEFVERITAPRANNTLTFVEFYNWEEFRVFEVSLHNVVYITYKVE